MRTFLASVLLMGCTSKAPGLDSGDGDSASVEAPWPSWVMEPWVWEDESTQESAIALVDGYIERDIPVGAIIIDSPWATGYSTYEWDLDLYPDPDGLPLPPAAARVRPSGMPAAAAEAGLDPGTL